MSEVVIALLEAAEKPWDRLSFEEKQIFSAWLDPSVCLRCGGRFICESCGLTPATLQRAANLWLLVQHAIERGKRKGRAETMRGSKPPSSPTLQRILNGRADPDTVATEPPPPPDDEDPDA